MAKGATGYGRRSLVETTIGRYKRIIGPQLRAKPPSASRFRIACLGPVARIPSVPPSKPHDPGDKAQTSLLKFSVQQRLANRRLLHQREAA